MNIEKVAANMVAILRMCFHGLSRVCAISLRVALSISRKQQVPIGIVKREACLLRERRFRGAPFSHCCRSQCQFGLSKQKGAQKGHKSFD